MTINTSFSPSLKLLWMIKKKQMWINKQEDLPCPTSLVAIARSKLSQQYWKKHVAFSSSTTGCWKSAISPKMSITLWEAHTVLVDQISFFLQHLYRLRCIWKSCDVLLTVHMSPFHSLHPAEGFHKMDPLFYISLSPARHQAGLRSLQVDTQKKTSQNFAQCISRLPHKKITRGTWRGRQHRGARLLGKNSIWGVRSTLVLIVLIWLREMYPPV